MVGRERKNGATHKIWPPARVLAIFEDLLDGSTHVFHRNGARPVGRLADHMVRVCKGWKERATPQDLRRTLASMVVALGFGRDLMDAVLNHVRRSSVTSIYDRHQYTSERRRVAEAVAARIFSLAEGREADDVIELQLVKAQISSRRG